MVQLHALILRLTKHFWEYQYNQRPICPITSINDPSTQSHQYQQILGTPGGIVGRG